ncbi:MAG: hypothetical protein ACRED0_06640 [Gammaproteobacteria bacterium]
MTWLAPAFGRHDIRVDNRIQDVIKKLTAEQAPEVFSQWLHLAGVGDGNVQGKLMHTESMILDTKQYHRGFYLRQ